jgi:hypothetical protein
MQRTHPHTTDDLVPTDGVAAFVERLDALARRRPRHDPRLPTILVTGAYADELVRDYSARLIVDGHTSVPHVLWEGSEGKAGPSPEAQLLDQVADGLSRSLPSGARGMRGARGLRLPRYWTIRHVLDAETEATTEPERRRELRDALYARRRRLGPPAGWIDPLAAWLANLELGPVKGALLARPMVATSRFVFGLRLNTGRRFAWFADEIFTFAGTRGSFLREALRLTRTGSDRANTTLVHRVLTLALLHDLHAATRSSLLSPMRRRRVTPFVVLLLHVAKGSTAAAFLDALATIDDEAVGRHALLVLATPSDEDPAEPAPVGGGVPAHSPRAAADRLLSIARSGALPERTLRVDVPGPPNEHDEQWLETHRAVQPLPVAGAVAIPVLAGIVLVAAVAALVAPTVAGEGSPRCPEEVADEVVGVGDGADGCEYFPHAERTESVVDDAMVAAEAAIARENAEVLASGEPYATIVFFAPMTIPDGPGRQGENALNQLRGTALAQQRANDGAARDPKRVATRVLLANPGDRFAHGEDVARQIVERADDDGTIIGVVGIGQSRQASRDAVRTLGRGGLPVVAGPVTGDAMIDASAHYYQVSPRNRRVAAMLAAFSTRSDIVRLPDRGAVPADGAVIVMDHSDEYSRNLAYDLYDAFGGAGGETRSMVTHPIEDPGATVPPPPVDDAPEPIRVDSSDELAQQVCASLKPRDVVFYASRSQEFISLLQSTQDESDCPDKLTVVGGSALTKIVEDPSNPLSDYDVSLYYSAFASQSVSYSPDTDRFMEQYQEAYGDDVVAPDISDGAVAYDAFNALQRTANYALQSELPISSDTSAGALGSEEIEFNGASGYVALGNNPISGDSPRVPPGKPVLVLPAGEGSAANTLACGRFSLDRRQETWGPDDSYSCPSDN